MQSFYVIVTNLRQRVEAKARSTGQDTSPPHKEQDTSLPSSQDSKLHNEELHNLYSSPSIMKMTKSKKMRWARHVARMHMILMEKAKKEVTRKANT
jgi:hypothetical protein